MNLFQKCLTSLFVLFAQFANAAVSSLTHEIAQGTNLAVNNHFHEPLMQSGSLHTFYGLIFIAVFIALMVLAKCIGDSQPVQHAVQPAADTDLAYDPAVVSPQAEEYDFMGSQEAVPAKFNLVEAYIQMKDFTQARRVLDEILTIGSNDQRQKASAYISQLPNA